MPGELGFDTGPYVNVATFCDQVIEGTDGVLSLIRVVDRLTVKAEGPEVPDDLPPGSVETNLVVMFKAGKARGAQRFRVTVESPNGFRKDGPVIAINFGAGEAGGANMNAKLKIDVTSAGLYWADVYLNDRLMTRIPLQINYEFTRTRQ